VSYYIIKHKYKTNGRDCNAPTKKPPTPYEKASNKISR
jgi:hypothetical protein